MSANFFLKVRYLLVHMNTIMMKVWVVICKTKAGHKWILVLKSCTGVKIWVHIKIASLSHLLWISAIPYTLSDTVPPCRARTASRADGLCEQEFVCFSERSKSARLPEQSPRCAQQLGKERRGQRHGRTKRTLCKRCTMTGMVTCCFKYQQYHTTIAHLHGTERSKKMLHFPGYPFHRIFCPLLCGVNQDKLGLVSVLSSNF